MQAVFGKLLTDGGESQDLGCAPGGFSQRMLEESTLPAFTLLTSGQNGHERATFCQHTHLQSSVNGMIFK